MAKLIEDERKIEGMHIKYKQIVPHYKENEKLLGGMQNGEKDFTKGIEILRALCSGTIKEEELRRQLEQNNGNVYAVANEIISELMKLKKDLEEEKKLNEFKKEEEKTEVGEIRPGINLQGYCINGNCLASKAKIPVWVNEEFKCISLAPNTTSFLCPDCKQLTVTSITKVIFFNSEHSICLKSNNYKCEYSIKSELLYKLKADKIFQHAESLEDLISRSENAMASNEILNLVKELQKYFIKIVNPFKVKDRERLLEKIQFDYGSDTKAFKKAFDVGRFTILCDNEAKLQTAVGVMKKAEQFKLIVSEDKDFFEKQSKTHHRFHNIKLYNKQYDVYVEMQATLKKFTTLEEYTVFNNPKLSHSFYECIRAWEPITLEDEDLKQASDETLQKINDIICEWINDKEIEKKAKRYKSHLSVGILRPPQLFNKSKTEIDSKESLKIAEFVYKQLCTFTPGYAKEKEREMTAKEKEKVKEKEQAIYMELYEYYKQNIIGDKNPASCDDFASILQESRKQEMEDDIAISRALETYIPLKANNYAYEDSKDDDKEKTYDCHQYVLKLLEEKEDKSEEKSEKQEQQSSHNNKKK
ncbi:viral A-type inclusion protein, partial [Reticulomyxa filosa]